MIVSLNGHSQTSVSRWPRMPMQKRAAAATKFRGWRRRPVAVHKYWCGCAFNSVGWQEIGERMFQIIFFVPLSKSTVLCQTVFGTQVLHSTLHACAKSEPELWFMTTTKWLGACGRPVLHWLASNLIIYGMRILCPKWLWKLDIDEIWIRHLLNVNRWQAPWNVGRC